MDEFYVTLPSNSNMELYPNNTPSHFFIKLSPAINLSGKWEVGLTEAIIPRNWFNVTRYNNKYTLITNEEIIETKELEDKEYLIPLTPVDGVKGRTVFDDINKNVSRLVKLKHRVFRLAENNVSLNIPRNFELHVTAADGSKLLNMLHLPEEDRILKDDETFNFSASTDVEGQYFILIHKNRTEEVKHSLRKVSERLIPVGLYRTPEELFKAFDKISLDIQVDRRVILTISDENEEIIFEDGLRDLLGFKNNEYARGSHIGDYSLELNAGITELFIYTNIIEFHHVGDIKAPLLKVIPVASEKEDQIVRIYPTPQYISVNKNYFDTIEIDITSSLGENIIFTGGKTLLVLSFRRRTE